MDYNDYIAQVGATFQIPLFTDGQFLDDDYQTATPRSIDYVENRIQRDLDFINSYVMDNSAALTAGSKVFTLPTDTGVYVVPTQVQLTVGGDLTAPLLPMSPDALFALYPSDLSANRGTPTYWAPYDGLTIRVAPTPDNNYGVTVFGTQRIPQLSSTNTTNALSTMLPDLYIAAANVFWASFQRDMMIAQGNQQQMLSGYETIYQSLIKPTLVEEYRRKFQSSGWQSRLPPAIATPPQS